MPIPDNSRFPEIGGARPLVSIIMANHQGERYLAGAIASVLAQSLDDLELIIADDASTDGSQAIIEDAAERDRRVKPIRLTCNGGPARARNAALEMARGHWIAIVDSDDLLHPERLERLLAAAAQIGADVVADDLMHFYGDGTPVQFLLAPHYSEPFFISAGDLIRSGTRRSPALGYLKPVIRAELLTDLRYDEAVRIGEDQDLLLRILLAGANVWVIPEPWYLYRRHSASISHRLSPEEVTGMIESQRRLMAAAGPRHPEVMHPLRRRLRRLERALAFENLIAAAKRGAILPALGAVLHRPALLAPLLIATGEHFHKRRRAPATQPRAAPTSVHLAGAAETKTPGDDPWLVVPDYLPPGSGDWKAPVGGSIWKPLGDLAAGAPLRVYCHGPGAAYAAGFIPAGSIELIRVGAAAESPRRPGPLLATHDAVPVEARPAAE